MSPAAEKLLDQILMLKMGNQGNTMAHLALESMATFPLRDSEEARWRFTGERKYGDVHVYIPPKERDCVVMFGDKSGIYVHEDGLCTIMGKDISHEVGQWQQVR